jgi:hypothetical protein
MSKTLSPAPLIHPIAEVRDCNPGTYTEVGARTRLLEVSLADYSYRVNDSNDWRRNHHVDIGHDMWIGHGAVILPGRRIGTGAVAGNPARAALPDFRTLPVEAFLEKFERVSRAV